MNPSERSAVEPAAHIGEPLIPPRVPEAAADADPAMGDIGDGADDDEFEPL